MAGCRGLVRRVIPAFRVTSGQRVRRHADNAVRRISLVPGRCLIRVFAGDAGGYVDDAADRGAHRPIRSAPTDPGLHGVVWRVVRVAVPTDAASVAYVCGLSAVGHGRAGNVSGAECQPHLALVCGTSRAGAGAGDERYGARWRSL